MSESNTETHEEPTWVPSDGLDLTNVRGLVATELSPQAWKESPFDNPSMLQRSQQSEQTDTLSVFATEPTNSWQTWVYIK